MTDWYLSLHIFVEFVSFVSSDIVTIEPINGAECYINGSLINGITELHSGDRVILGQNHVFRFNNPLTRK